MGRNVDAELCYGVRLADGIPATLGTDYQYNENSYLDCLYKVSSPPLYASHSPNKWHAEYEAWEKEKARLLPVKIVTGGCDDELDLVLALEGSGFRGNYDAPELASSHAFEVREDAASVLKEAYEKLGLDWNEDKPKVGWYLVVHYNG